MRSLHIRMAAIDQHTAQTAFQHQFHLFSHHCRIVNLQRGQQFVSEIVRRAFLLICQLMNGVRRIDKNVQAAINRQPG